MGSRSLSVAVPGTCSRWRSWRIPRGIVAARLTRYYFGMLIDDEHADCVALYRATHSIFTAVASSELTKGTWRDWTGMGRRGDSHQKSNGRASISLAQRRDCNSLRFTVVIDASHA
jgi:hypothetical protein